MDKYQLILEDIVRLETKKLEPVFDVANILNSVQASKRMNTPIKIKAPNVRRQSEDKSAGNKIEKVDKKVAQDHKFVSMARDRIPKFAWANQTGVFGE